MSSIDIRLRVTPEMKTEAEEVFKEMGITMSEAIRIFLSQCINSGGLPFKPHAKTPNVETIKILEQSKQGIGVKKFANVEDMFNDLYKELEEEGFEVKRHA